MVASKGEAARQTTLKNSIDCVGVGLHSGVKTRMTLRPAPADTGIVFHRTDAAGRGAEIAARYDHAVETPLCTTLNTENGVQVATIEHMMSALAGYRIDNAIVELDGPEVPIMDGSAAPFAFLIECAGIVELDAPRRAIAVRKTVEVTDGKRTAQLSPGDGMTIDFEIDFDSAAIARQRYTMEVTPENFRRELARARTFGFLQEVDQLRQVGLCRGGSLDNAIVIDGDSVMNEGGLRFDNEFVRHKILDSIGDLYLAGAPIIGHFDGCRTGHALNLRLLKALFADPEAWCWTEVDAEGRPLDFDSAPTIPQRAVAASA
jgi:UDP-3-O-[3-hydroxymyristoyl] N-acetylglucosamine deacetylase